MFKEETLNKVDRRTYEEPDGEFIELIESGNNTLTVLTQVEELGPPIDPSDFSVADLGVALEGHDFSSDEISRILKAEEDGKNRTTAISTIKDLR